MEVRQCVCTYCMDINATAKKSLYIVMLFGNKLSYCSLLYTGIRRAGKCPTHNGNSCFVM